MVKLDILPDSFSFYYLSHLCSQDWAKFERPEKELFQTISLHEAQCHRIELLIVYQDNDGDNELLLAAMKGLEDYVIYLIFCLVSGKC